MAELATTTSTDDTPPASPEPGGAGTSSPTGDGAGTSTQSGAGESAHPEGTPGGGEAAAAPEGDPTVRWEDFRKARHERRQYRERAQSLEQELETLKGQVAQFEEHRKGSETTATQLRYLQEVLRRHPDVLDMLDERERVQGRTNGASPTNGHGVTSELLKPIESQIAQMAKRLDDLHGGYQQSREVQRAASERAKFEQTGREVSDGVQKLLKARSLDPTVYQEDAFDFIVKEAATLGDCEMEDLPFLFGRWLKKETRKWDARDQIYRDGKAGDRRTLPPSVPTNGAPVQGIPATGRNDTQTKQLMAEKLRSVLGWTG